MTTFSTSRLSLALSLSCLIGAASCGSEERIVDGELYSMVCGDRQEVTCASPNESTGFDDEGNSGDSNSLSCTWRCTDYDGETDRFIRLEFERSGDCYDVTVAIDSLGICTN